MFLTACKNYKKKEKHKKEGLLKALSIWIFSVKIWTYWFKNVITYVRISVSQAKSFY